MKLVFRASFFLFIFFLISCKKDKKDTIAPGISCFAPATGQHFNMYDTITVNATVSDNEHLSFVNVTLTDLNHTPLQPSYSVPIQSASFTFNIKYILTQFHLQTGSYFLQITADDGYNTSSFYQPITITESPTLLWGYCTVLKNSSQIINFIAPTGTTTISSIVLSQVYNGMKYGTYNQQLYVNGKGTRPFQAFYLQPQAASQLTYNASATNTQADYTSLYTDGYKPYVGFLNSDINSFDNVGSYSTSYRLGDPNFYSYLFTKTSNYGVGVFKSKIGNVPDKIVSFSAYGAFFQSTPLPTTNFTVVAMFEKGNDSVYVFGNDASNQAQGYFFYVPSNNPPTQLTNTMPSGKMLSAVKVSSNYALFSTATGVYPVNSISVSSFALPGSTGAQKLAYQPKLNTLVASAGIYLNSYSVSTNSLTLIGSPINCGDSIVDFEVITNK